MGNGIWAMHYIGMLAFRLPIPVYYHVPTVILSLLAAILASLVALYVVSREAITPIGVAVGSLLMGSGIAAMHYTGMAAMRLAAMHHYDQGLWILSIVLAIVISFVGLLVISQFRDEAHGSISKLFSAVTLGLAIPVMHYTGMAAVSFMATGAEPDLSHSVDASVLAISAILTVTLLTLAAVVTTALFDRRLSVQQSILEEAEAFINSVPSILIGVDHLSHVTRWNSTAAAAFGLSGDDVLGKELAACGVRWLRPGMRDEIRSWCSERASRRCDQVPFEMNGETRLLGLTITSLHVAAKHSTELLVIGSDVTERTALEVQLRHAQKLESVGQLASGIAHEINTPTQYIGDNVRFLQTAFVDLKGLLVNYERLLAAAAGDALSSETVQ